jgi:SAM-dependent methyltransferase
VSTPRVGTSRYWDELASRRWGRYISEAETKAVERAQSAAPQPRHALDVGCGGGRWTRMLLERGWSVTASDVDPDAVQSCAARNPAAQCVLVREDDRRLAADDRSVSLVLCIEVLPVVDSDWFLPEVRRVLVPRGRLVTIAWNGTSLRGKVANAVSRIRHGAPHPFYGTPYRVWRQRLEDAGMRIDTVRGLCWFPFGRASDSRMVPVAAALEQRLGLSRLTAFSPWVLVTASRLPGGAPV